MQDSKVVCTEGQKASTEVTATSQAVSTKGCSQEDESRTRYIAENGKGYLTSGEGTTLR